MKRILSFLAYTAAILSTPIILAVFIGMGFWQQKVMELPFMKIDPTLTGGDVVETVTDSAYTVEIHEKIYPGWLFKGDTGYVQLKITTTDSLATNLNITDLNIDEKKINLNLNETTVEAENMTVNMWCKTHDGWIIRVE